MKKIVLMMFALLAAVTMNAQVYVGGEIGMWYDGDDDKASFVLSPEVGYNLNEKWAVGGALHFSTTSYDNDELLDVKSTGFALAPYARYSFYENKVVRLFVDGTIGFSIYKTEVDDSDVVDLTGFEIGIKPGIALKVNSHFSFVAKCGFLGYREDYLIGENGFGLAATSEDLSFGFHYEF